MTPVDPAETRKGLAAALACFAMWGVFGLYFKLLAALPAPEVLAHRILGGALFAFLLLALRGGLAEVRQVLVDWRRLRLLTASALCIAVNWGLFIWAVANGRALESSMGYFIFPLMSVLLGRLVFNERLGRRQGAAVAVVAAGVGWMILRGHGVPWLALMLAVSFAGYGLLRKLVPVSALGGLLIEALLLAPAALLYLVVTGGGEVPRAGVATQAVIALAGPVTAVPLVLFAVAARRLKMSTIGLLMYLNPTLQMLVAVFAFGEPFTAVHAVVFAAIWVGLALYSWPGRASPH